MIRSAVAIGFLLACSSLAFGQGQLNQDLSSLPPLVRKSFVAGRTARYSGERIVQFRHGGDRTRHVEIVLKDGPRTRIEFPEDSAYKGQVIVEDGKQRLHYYPDRNEIDVEPAHEHGGGRDFRGQAWGARPKYTHSMSEGGQIAGFSTEMDTVSDPSGNVVQQLWIEPKTGVVLKRALFDAVGTQVGYFEFTRIDFSPVFAPGDFRIDRKGAAIITPITQARRLAQKLGLTPILLPPSAGYQMQSVRVIHPDNRDVLAEMYVGADGRFTLFQLRGDVNQQRLQNFAKGRLSAYAWTRGQEGFALVGNLPEGKLRQIANVLGDR